MKQPGRVATLVEDPDHHVWGVAFKIPESKIPDVCRALAVREKDYETYFLPFHPRGSGRKSFEIMLYIASPNHPNFKPAEQFEIAEDVKQAVGPSGENMEYLLRLAEYVRKNIPEDRDDHLFHLERLVKPADVKGLTCFLRCI